MKVTTQNAGDVLKALEEKATDRFLNKVDFDIVEWLEGDELKDYRQAYIIEFGGCPTCGDGIIKGDNDEYDCVNSCGKKEEKEITV